MTSHPCQSLFLSNAFSDVTFIVDNQPIPAHKMLLAANCPYFQTMLFGATNESKMAVVELNNVSHKIFIEVLRCVYLRKVDLSEWTPEEVKKLILIADEYQFPELSSVVAETLNIDTQVTIDIIEEAVGVAKRLNCNRLMERCVETTRKRTEFLFTNEDAFDKLPMDFIIHLIDNKVWNPADARLVYSIGNWRKTGSVEDKKVLLSKIDWKSLPGKYSEPLVRMFLENDADGLQVKDWTNSFKTDNAFVDKVAAVYLSYHHRLYNQRSQLCSLFSAGSVVIDNETEQACVAIFLREQVTNITKIKFKYDGKAAFTLKLFGVEGETEISATNIGRDWEFDLTLNVNIWSLILQIYNKEFGNTPCKPFPASYCHYISNFEFCSN